MGTPFYKYQGLGNDFLIIESEEAERVAPDWARAVCDRHRGVGADGVLIVGVHGQRPFMRVINADGSTPEMCGNGIRCVALHLANGMAQRKGLSGDTYRIETDAGPHTCHVTLEGPLGTTGLQALVEVEMAVPSLAPERIPLRASQPLVDTPIEISGRALRVTAVSMGNPHLICFDPVGDARLTLGPSLASVELLPESANVSFARLADDGAIDLSVLERGAGWTQACGTGACAAAVAAVRTGRAQAKRWIEVRLPGGLLQIMVGSEDEPVRMKGAARHVFDGTWPTAPTWQ